MFGRQEGFILGWAVAVAFMGIATITPVLVLVLGGLRAQGDFNDQIRDYYVADATIHAVIEDLIRGADPLPLPPATYTPPIAKVSESEVIPSVSIELAEFPTLSTVKIVDLRAASDPTVIQGIAEPGGAAKLRDDDDFFEVTFDGDPPQVIWEATSEEIEFPTVSFGEVRLMARAHSENARIKVEVFIFNPLDSLHTENGYNPIADVTRVLDPAHQQLEHHDDDDDDDDHDETVTVTARLAEADIDFLNSNSTPTLKVKVRVTDLDNDPEGFRFDTDQLVFALVGSVTTDQRSVLTEPVINLGSLPSGSAGDLASWDLSRYTLRSVQLPNGDDDDDDDDDGDDDGDDDNGDHVAEIEVISQNFALSEPDTVTVTIVARADIDDVELELLVFRPSTGRFGFDHEDDDGDDDDGDLIVSARSRHGESFVRTGFVGVESGLYTIVFFNESHGPVNTEPFAASGDEEDTWIYLSAFKDYLVKVTVGTAGLQAVVRQIPGPTEPPLSGKLAHQASLLQFGEPELPFSPWSPDNINWIENMVLIQSWEFFGVAE